ncbi:MAG: hypothetical protein PGN11_19845 [Quadrisphaera sp.]
MAGQTEGSGERRRALDAERAGSGRRVAGHVAPVLPVDSAPPAALSPQSSPASSPAPAAAARDPFTTPPAGAPVVRPATGAHASASAPTPPLGTPLPSRRDRVALRRPTVLDEAAVQASDTAAWRTSPALEDPRTASAIARPSPLTHALARTLTEHLESLTPPAGLSSTPPSASSTSAPSSRSAGALREAPSVYVPRRRPAPAVSGPLPVVSTTTTPAESRREPSWTTEPVAPRRSQRPEPRSPFTSAPLGAGPLGAGPLGAGLLGAGTGDASPFASAPAAPRWSGDHSEPELPPPPPAAEVEAAARARAARFSTAPVPPPMPDRVSPDPAGRTSLVVPGLPTTGLASSATPAAGASAPPGTASSGLPTTGLPPVSGPTAALTAADLAVLRAVTADRTGATAAAPAAPAASPSASRTASTTALPSEPRHGRPSRSSSPRTDRTARTGRAAGRSTDRGDRRASAEAPTSSTSSTDRAARTAQPVPSAGPSRAVGAPDRRRAPEPVPPRAAAAGTSAAPSGCRWACWPQPSRWRLPSSSASPPPVPARGSPRPCR